MPLLASTNITCFGSNNGTITISSPTGGSGAYEYTINGGTSGSPQESIPCWPLPPIMYRYGIKMIPSCIKTLNGALVISQPAQLNATLTSTNVTCFGKSNGTIVISAPDRWIRNLPVQPQWRYHVAGFGNFFTACPRVPITW